ncbi:MAG: conjugal transfer protein TraX [Clostridiales bacterium]|jgi:hypothetical protein|nr:conjugal transfer protein TraX [Clostridiales bacterium]
MTSLQLKITLVVLMVIDHIGAMLTAARPNSETLIFVITLMRSAGRCVFPLFAFLCAEGCFHTKNIWNYLRRMLIFAVISEIPYNIFRGILNNQGLTVLNFDKQNVLFTLALGIFTVIIYRNVQSEKSKTLKAMLWAAIALIIIASEFLFCEYGARGSLLVLLIYACAHTKLWGQIFPHDSELSYSAPVYAPVLAAASFAAMFYYNMGALYIIGALFAGVLAAFYNGKPGKKIKYAFYIFYPAHICVLSLIWIVFF